MKTRSTFPLVVAVLVSLCIAIPADLWAAPQTAGQRAGEVSRVIPAVSIARGAKTINASAKTAVDWQDAVNTQAGARARIALDDGSVLNVGSDSSMRIVKHDAGAQQTNLELTYGKLRSQAQKIAQSGGKFEVRTPAGVAGVVGTDFYVGYENNVMTVIVFEGVVRVCNLAGLCVDVKAGQMTTVRTADNAGPAAPAQAALSLLTETASNTDVGGLSNPTQGTHHISKGTAITLGILAVIPAIVIPIVVSHGNSGAVPPPKGQCPPTQGCP